MKSVFEECKKDFHLWLKKFIRSEISKGSEELKKLEWGD